MSWLRVRPIFCLAAATWAAASATALGQAPADWQPFRDSAAVDSATVELMPEAMPPQMLVDPTMICPQPVFEAPGCEVPIYYDPTAAAPKGAEFWQWRLLPEGVIWQSYWAGAHESKLAGVPYFNQHGEATLDVALGGRASVVRFGSDGPGRPLGAELQIEGAAFPRLNLDENWDLDATDFRFGLPLVYGRELWEAKFSYYHLSAHMGDEFAIRNAALGDRINFSRDALVAALAYYPLPAWRWYAEAGWAFYYDGGSEPWEFQFGVDVAEPGPTGGVGTPFLAINGHLREEHNFGGNVVLQAGWLWRGQSTRTVRLGFHYYNGKSNQFEFFDNFEEQIGGGVWYEF